MSKPRVRVTTDGRVRLDDGFMNVAANLGVPNRDKSANATFTYAPLHQWELLSTYRQSWLARKLIDIVPEDATRNWRQWNASPEEITAIEATEAAHRLREKLTDALRVARLTGGAALYISVRGQKPEEPLDLNRVRKGDLLNLALLNRYQLSCTQIEASLENPRFGLPAMFQFSGVGTGSMVNIHPTRLAIFEGPKVPDAALNSWAWGDPMLQSVMDTVKQAEAFPANVVSLLYEANVDILTIPDLMSMLAEEGGDLKVTTYLQTVARIKGNNGMLILDGGDSMDAGTSGNTGTKFDRKAISFSGVAELWDRIMQVSAGAADIPMTRLWGRSPAGMNATGESDLINYYQNVNTRQTNEIEPACTLLDQVIIRSALGQPAGEIYYDWRPIYEESSESRVNRGKTTVEIIKALAETGLFPDEVLQAVAKSAMIETGALPGMESAIHELSEEADALEDPELLAEADIAALPRQRPQLRLVRDSRTASLYINRPVLNAEAILAHYRKQGFKKFQAASELHVTILYSKTPVDWMAMPEAWESELELAPGGPRLQEVLGPKQEAQVLLFGARSLMWRNEELMRAGASSDYPEYTPHITLSYEEDLSKAEPWNGAILLGPEIWQEIKSEAITSFADGDFLRIRKAFQKELLK